MLARLRRESMAPVGTRIADVPVGFLRIPIRDSAISQVWFVVLQVSAASGLRCADGDVGGPRKAHNPDSAKRHCRNRRQRIWSVPTGLGRFGETAPDRPSMGHRIRCACRC